MRPARRTEGIIPAAIQTSLLWLSPYGICAVLPLIWNLAIFLFFSLSTNPAGCLDAIANGVIRDTSRLEAFLQRFVGLGTGSHHNSVHAAQLFLLAVLLHDESFITNCFELAAGLDLQIRTSRPCHHGLQSANVHATGDLRQHFYEQQQ